MNTRNVAFTSDFDNGCDRCHKMIPSGEFFTHTQFDGIICDNCGGIWPLVFIPSSKPDLIKKAKQHSDELLKVLRFEDRCEYERVLGILVTESTAEQIFDDEESQLS